MLEFIVLAYTMGPMATTTYGLHALSMTPLEVFVYLSALNILPLPLFFWVFEHAGRYRELYRMKIFRKVAKVTDETMEEIMAKGDKITLMFEEKLGHLGFYLSIIVFTFIFGVLWAAVFSYILAVNRRRAMICISASVIVGNVFWLLLIEHFKDYVTPTGMIAIAVSVPLLVYGSRREMSVIREVAAKFSAKIKKDIKQLKASS